MHRKALAVIAFTLTLCGCSFRELGIPDFPLGVPEQHCSLMDPLDCRVPVPPKRIAP